MRQAEAVVAEFTCLPPRKQNFLLEASKVSNECLFLIGLSAPLVYYLVRRQRIGRWALLGWNFSGLGLLLHVVVTAVLSPVQRFALEQPNGRLLYFPFD